MSGLSETDRDALVTALRKCRVEDAPNPLFAEHDLNHIAGSLAPTVAALVAEAEQRGREAAVVGLVEAIRNAIDDDFVEVFPGEPDDPGYESMEAFVAHLASAVLAAHPAPSPAVPVGALLASFEHEDWCCAKGCACHVRPCPGCTCLVDIVRRHIEALTDAGEGCDCAELCSMGPTCTGGMQAGLAGSSCWRSPAVPPAPTLAGLAEADRVALAAFISERLFGYQDGPYMNHEAMAATLVKEVNRHILAHLSPPGVPDRSDAGDVT